MISSYLNPDGTSKYSAPTVKKTPTEINNQTNVDKKNTNSKSQSSILVKKLNNIS